MEKFFRSISRALSHYFYNPLRILFAAIYGFNRDDCYLKASALTFYSMLSIVPVLAVAFGIAKGFGLDQMLETSIRTQFEEHSELITQVIVFAQSYLEQTKGGVIAGVGALVLLWTVSRLLATIEDAFNQIWKVKIQRSFLTKMSNYLAIIIVGPIFFIASSSLTVFLNTEAAYIASGDGWLSSISPFLAIFLKVLPYLLIWTLLTLIYVLIPNTRVALRYGLIGGIIAGTAFQILQWAYIHFQFALSQYGAIYGSFAALPLFLLWLQGSWFIVLAGAEITYYSEDRRAEGYFAGLEYLSFSAKKELAQRIVNQVVTSFKNKDAPPTTEHLSDQLQLPNDIVQEIVDILISENILSVVYTRKGSQMGYHPAMDVAHITPEVVNNALDNHGTSIMQ